MSCACAAAFTAGLVIADSAAGLAGSPMLACVTSCFWTSVLSMYWRNWAQAGSAAPVVQDQPPVRHVWILVEMVDARCVERRGTADQAVYLIALLEEKLCQVGSILARYAGHQRAPSSACPSRHSTLTLAQITS